MTFSSLHLQEYCLLKTKALSNLYWLKTLSKANSHWYPKSNQPHCNSPWLNCRMNRCHRFRCRIRIEFCCGSSWYLSPNYNQTPSFSTNHLIYPIVWTSWYLGWRMSTRAQTSRRWSSWRKMLVIRKLQKCICNDGPLTLQDNCSSNNKVDKWQLLA